MHVEVLDGEIVEFAETLVAEDGGLEGFELFEMVLGVRAVVGLEDLGEEKDAVGFSWVEDCRAVGGLHLGWLSLFGFKFLNLFLSIAYAINYAHKQTPFNYKFTQTIHSMRQLIDCIRNSNKKL